MFERCCKHLFVPHETPEAQNGSDSLLARQ